MIIPPKDIEELRRICRSQGQELSEAEALDVGRRIVRFIIHYTKLYGPPVDLPDPTGDQESPPVA